MGWDRVWTLALVQFGAEDIEIRILIGLGMAFLTLMIVEGVRASFRLRAPKLLPEPPVMQRSFAPAATLGPATKVASQPLRARTVVTRAIPKPVKAAVSRHQPAKPRIRRRHAVAHKPIFTEEAAPYSPLSPNC